MPVKMYEFSKEFENSSLAYFLKLKMETLNTESILKTMFALGSE